MNANVSLIEPWENQFIYTQEYRRFEELVQACHHYRYIGLCFGDSGVGKSWAARHYAHWESLVKYVRLAYVHSKPTVPTSVFNACRAVYYNVPVTNTPRIIRQDLALEFDTYRDAYAQISQVNLVQTGPPLALPVLIVDEAERLTLPSLEELRDLHDRHLFGLLLIGSSNIRKIFKSSKQFFARIGFAHEFAPLTHQDVANLLTQEGTLFGYSLDTRSFADETALSALISVTKGNFRLLKRLIEQIHRVMTRNNTCLISQDVIETACFHCLLE